MNGPLDYVSQTPGMAMDPYMMVGLGMLSQAHQPGPVGIGAGAMQGLQAYQQGMLAQSQMQQAELQNQAARSQMARASQQEMDRLKLLRTIPDPATRAAAAVDPEAYATAQFRAPSTEARNFAWFNSLPPTEQDAYLRMKRSMSPFAGMADFMSPLGADAAKWTNDAGESPPPELSGQQAARAGYTPEGPKPTQKQEDTVAAALNMLDQEELMLEQELMGYDPTSRVSQAAGYISPLRSAEQEKWTMAAEQGTTAYGVMMSGAEVTDAQRRQFRLEQYPVAGEEQATVDAKRRRRLQQMRNQLTARRVPKDHPVWQRLKEFEARLGGTKPAVPQVPSDWTIEEVP